MEIQWAVRLYFKSLTPAVTEFLQVRVHKGSDAEVQGKVNTRGFCRTSQPVDHCRVPCSMVLWLIDARLWDSPAVSGCVQPPAYRNYYWWKDPDCSWRDIRPDWSGLPQRSGATQSQEKNSLITYYYYLCFQIPIVRQWTTILDVYNVEILSFLVIFFTLAD